MTCILRNRHRIRSVGPHLQLDVPGGKRDPLDMALDQVSITVRDWVWRGGAARLQIIAQCGDDKRLDLGRRHPPDRAGASFVLQQRLGDVIAIAHATLVGMARAHALAAIVKQTTGQNGGRAAQPAAPRHTQSRTVMDT